MTQDVYRSLLEESETERSSYYRKMVTHLNREHIIVPRLDVGTCVAIHTKTGETRYQVICFGNDEPVWINDNQILDRNLIKVYNKQRDDFFSLPENVDKQFIYHSIDKNRSRFKKLTNISGV